MDFLIRRDTPVVPHKKHWQFCVGSGHALLALRTDYTRQLRFIHDTLGIQRVRFHGIFNDDMRTCNSLSDLFEMEDAKNFKEYNFHACGVAYDNVLDAGMKPFVELSFMPKHLMSQDGKRMKEGGFYYKPLIVPPEDEQAWADYIQAFIRFLIHRYGVEEVRTWYFEVWNEPDLQGAFFNGSRDEYFRMYEVTARAIKAVDSQIPVGGPATSGSKWVKSFLKFCKENDVPVDFVTTHQYSGDPLGGVEDQGDPMADGEGSAGFDVKAFLNSMGPKLKAAQGHSMLEGLRALMGDQSEERDIPNDGFFRNSAIVRKQAGDMPLYYTEWNENAGFGSYTNDTRKVAAYDVKASLDVMDSMDGSSIWCFSDVFEEFHPFPEEFHGGFGMLSQSGIPKPVYHAMKMLADAGDERLRDVACVGGRRVLEVLCHPPEEQGEDDAGVAARAAQQCVCVHLGRTAESSGVLLRESGCAGSHGKAHIRARVAVGDGEDVELVYLVLVIFYCGRSALHHANEGCARDPLRQSRFLHFS